MVGSLLATIDGCKLHRSTARLKGHAWPEYRVRQKRRRYFDRLRTLVRNITNHFALESQIQAEFETHVGDGNPVIVDAISLPAEEFWQYSNIVWE